MSKLNKKSLTQIAQGIAHLLDIKSRLWPLHKSCRKVILMLCIPLLVLLLGGFWIAALLYAYFLLFVCFFFRNPKRYTPQGPGLMISTADGMISSIGYRTVPRHLGFPKGKKMKYISIFMGLLDVHVNRSPASGKIVAQYYKPGSFMPATDAAGSESGNEFHAFRMEMEETKQEIVFVQIAGTVARRILSPVKDGSHIKRGEEFGIIKFGSRMELYVPDDWDFQYIIKGQRVIAGESIIAKRNTTQKSK